ncbi:tumor necrosis factor ligand superfamily member 12 isoform X2 [Physeter macrocephalus]|uniref:Tumor necrosis factor ligand superfamily member 12 isoform X2 n=1 Tax=Physeter macrocephalus TaxID=9755 RepID=A0A9W2WJT0_PHYMC|nr:tumor necrosis factor ligand superfamily member 12 isoform X2 [Physeter catodon]
MAARRSQRRRGRRGEPGTALLAPLVLGLGLALACLGLLLAVVSLGSRASLSAQEPSQGELVAEEDPDPLDLNPQIEERQDALPFLKLVRPRRSAPKGRKPRARRATAAHYEVHPQPGQDGAQAESCRSDHFSPNVSSLCSSFPSLPHSPPQRHDLGTSNSFSSPFPILDFPRPHSVPPVLLS